MSVKVDGITNCDKEPIHIPGSIQPHNVLLVLQEPELTIVQVSNNTQSLLGLPPEELLNSNLAALAGQAQTDSLRVCLSHSDLPSINPLKLNIEIGGQASTFDGVLHRTNGCLVLELEPTQTPELLPLAHVYHIMSSSASQLQHATSLVQLCQLVVEEMRRVTGFDRVMIYRFDSDRNGEVIAEAKLERLAPYLGLHYPASDIPRQARELYRRTWLRLVANVDYQPAPILPANNPVTGGPLDLSFSVSRSVSPMYIEYLKNMGVRASMSVSLIKNDRLWGLISCYHQEPNYVPYEIRTICELLGQILSLRLAVWEDSRDYVNELQVKDIQAQLLQRILEEENFIDGLLKHDPNLLQLIDAQGAVMCFDGQFHGIGTTPRQEELQLVRAWLQQQVDEDVFSTNSLPALDPAFAQLKDVASGLLAISLSRMRGNYLLWFRPEVIQCVNWGGDPNKPVEIVDAVVHIHPRKSSQLWQQTIQMTSLPWKQRELDAAFRLRSALIDSALIAMEDQRERVDEHSTSNQHTLGQLTQRMESLIDSLLHYSRVGHMDLATRETDLNDVLAQVLDSLRFRLAETGTTVLIPRPLPTIVCDHVHVSEIFTNLITNAIKYNDKEEKYIEIGSREPAGKPGYAGPTVLYVRDNGIGIPERYYEVIFRIFKRLHRCNECGGGTGTGLTIVKRIVERHGGRIWVESTPDVGSTFYFTLEKAGGA
jgi:two-component system, chemotaxis family, sensor kinase Cph1